MPYRIPDQISIEDMNLSYFCRSCKQTVRGIPLTEPQYRSTMDGNPWIVCRCPTKHCDLTFVIYNELNDRILQTFPLSGFSAENYHQSIPVNIREDLAEADRCFYAGAFKGSVSMNRRVVQNIILDKIKDPAIKKKNLWEQIELLLKAGFITKHLSETAHEIRHFGNFGAHSSDDALDKTNSEDAKMIDNLTSDLIRIIYITPYETEQLKAKRIGSS